VAVAETMYFIVLLYVVSVLICPSSTVEAFIGLIQTLPSGTGCLQFTILSSWRDISSGVHFAINMYN
jgi:hypothetical protein